MRDDRIRLVPRVGEGYLVALNEMLGRARCDLVARMDADDIAMPDRLRQQAGYLRDHPSCLVVGSRIQVIDPDGDPLCLWNAEMTHAEIDAIHMEGSRGAVICHPSAMMRREAVLSAGGYRERFYTAEDLDLFLRLAERGELANLPEILLKYRLHPASVCHVQKPRQREAIEAAIAEARTRRGLTPAPAPGGVSSPAVRPRSRRNWGWWALMSGHIATARKHALAGVAESPLSVATPGGSSSALEGTLNELGERPGLEARGVEGPATAGADGAAPLSIAFISPGWPPEAHANGVVTSVATLTAEFRRQGHRALILAADVPGAPGRSRRLRLPSTPPPLGPPPTGDRSAHVSRHARALALATSLPGSGRADRPPRRRAGRPVGRDGGGVGPAPVRPARDLDPDRRQAPRPVVPQRPACKGHATTPGFGGGSAPRGGIISAAGISAPSMSVLKRTRSFYGLPLETAEVIPNLAPAVGPSERWRRGESDPNLTLFIGRFDRHKGGDLIIDAFARVAGRDPRARLCFVGPDWGLVDDRGRRRQLAEFVEDRLPGASNPAASSGSASKPPPRSPGLRRAAGVTVCCSRYETYGFTLVEAMAFGCPVDRDRRGAVPELIEDGVERAGLPDGRPGDSPRRSACSGMIATSPSGSGGGRASTARPGTTRPCWPGRWPISIAG